MLEIKVTVEAIELVNALNNLAAAMGGVNVVKQAIGIPAPQPTAAPQPPVTVPAPMSFTVPQQSIPAPVQGVPLAQPPAFTTDQIMAAGAALVDAGRSQDLINLLHSFGVQGVTALKPEQLGAFATAMREMGASI